MIIDQFQGNTISYSENAEFHVQLCKLSHKHYNTCKIIRGNLGIALQEYEQFHIGHGYAKRLTCTELNPKVLLKFVCK